MEICANPGCNEPSTNKCAGCKTTPYCGPICQTVHWPTHKESCDGRLRKMGMDHLNKAKGFARENNWSQALRHIDLAVTKLKQLKDRPIEDISTALGTKCDILGFLDRFREQLECTKEWYCLWNTKPTDMGAIIAALALIESCIFNKEFADARLYASTLNGIINHKYDNKIPEVKRQEYIARGAHHHAKAILYLALNGGIPPAEKQKAGQETIALARKALEIHTQLLGGNDNADVCDVKGILADALDHFNDDDGEEVLRLHEQALSGYSRLQGSSSYNVAVSTHKIASLYSQRAINAAAAKDLDRHSENIKLSIPYFREASRIYRAVGYMDDAEETAQFAASYEQQLQLVTDLNLGK